MIASEKVAGETVNGGPWWVNAILKLGVIPVITLWLIWSLTNEVKKSLDAITASVTSHTEMTNGQSSLASIHERQTADVQFRLTQILQVLQVSCVNAAKDTSTRNACFK